MIKRWFPNARIVADRFQVVRVLLGHFMDLCRQISPIVESHRGYLALLRMAPERLSADQLKASGFPALVTLAQTLQSWREEIACMWRFSKNNGITEGFHRKMKLIQRRAYGFRNFHNSRLRVIAQCG